MAHRAHVVFAVLDNWTLHSSYVNYLREPIHLKVQCIAEGRVSSRGSRFMRGWLRDHVVSSHTDPANADEVRQLVIFCIGEAHVAGLHIAEIEEEYGQNIEAIIRNELIKETDA